MVKIRRFRPADAKNCEEILKLNNQLTYPEIDGIKAMMRVYNRQGRYFLVASEKDSVTGLIRGVYDGSRALIWELSVHPDYKCRGIGRELVKELLKRFKEDGAPTASVTVTEKSENYYKKIGFEETPVKLLIAEIKKKKIL
jgi:ribosomal protein S18 acetylase RimI-like enzyme